MTATTSQSGSGDFVSHVRANDILRPVSIDASRYAWRVWALLIVTITVLYALLLNPYWVPGGDSELYIAVARNWALGRGHTFNGNSVSICPPGWPLLLAGAMKISPTFLFLKLITLACMVAALSMWYWILLRFTTPMISALIVLMTAIVQHVYSLSFWMHSDALFCVIASAAMLLACQVNERRPGAWWRIALLVILCVGMSFVRWAGILQWLLVAGLLLRWHPHESEVAKNRYAPWIALALSCVATFATFWIVRQALHLSPQEAQIARDAGAEFDENQPQQVIPPPTAESKTVDIITAKSSAKKSLVREYADRVLKSGRWFAWFFWPATRFIGSGPKWLNWIDAAAGWPLLILLAAAIVQGVRRRQWVWPALGLYCTALCLNWPNPNARYLVPVAPLLIWGVVRGIELVGDRGAKWTQLHRRAIVALFVTVLLCNGALYAVDLAVARSGKFYAKYEGGLDQSLIDACAYLNSKHLDPRRLAVSERYENLGRKRPSKFGLRAAVMLTDLEIVNTPMDYGEDVDSPRFAKWSRQRKVAQWYLYQQPISPWRLWHLRVPKPVQRILTTQPVGRPSEGWVLYRRGGNNWEKVDVPKTAGWPTCVPGM